MQNLAAILLTLNITINASRFIWYWISHSIVPIYHTYIYDTYYVCAMAVLRATRILVSIFNYSEIKGDVTHHAIARDTCYVEIINIVTLVKLWFSIGDSDSTINLVLIQTENQAIYVESIYNPNLDQWIFDRALLILPRLARTTYRDGSRYLLTICNFIAHILDTTLLR